MRRSLRSDILALSRAPAVGRPSFEEFFLAHREPLYRSLCLITRNSHLAEELMQDAFVRVYERWESVGTMENPAGYLYRTAMNAFRQMRRRAAIASRHVLGRIPDDDQIGLIEDRDRTIRALRTLSPRQRAVVVLVDMLEFRPGEAAGMLGLRSSTVRVHLTRARAALEAELVEDP